MEENKPTLEEFLNNLEAQGEQQTEETQQEQQAEIQQEAQLQEQTEQQAQAVQEAREEKPGPSILELQQQLQQMQEQQRQLNEWLAVMAGMLAQQKQPEQETVQVPQVEVEVPEELPEELKQEIEQLYLEDPAKAVAKVAKYQIQQVRQKELEQQLKQQQEVQARQQMIQRDLSEGYAELIRRYGQGEVERLAPQVEEILGKEHADLLLVAPKKALFLAYDAARGRQAAQASVDDLLQKLLADQNARAKLKQLLQPEILKEHVTTVAQQESPPVVIANQPGGAQPVVPPNEPRTLDESMKMWLASMKH